jgi:hypothetical protein
VTVTRVTTDYREKIARLWGANTLSLVAENLILRQQLIVSGPPNVPASWMTTTSLEGCRTVNARRGAADYLSVLPTRCPEAT